MIEHSLLKNIAHNSESPVRLIVFPFAGGSANSFLNWQKDLKNISIVSVDIPRIDGKTYKSMTLLATEVTAEIEKLPQKTNIFFGHSMGAILAYEVASIFFSKNLPLPVRIIVSGSAAPTHLRKKSLHKSSDGELREYLFRLGGIPQEVLDNNELMAIFLPFIRNDLEIIETYQYETRPQLPIDLNIFWGTLEDNIFSALPWKDLFSKRASISKFNGNHFFIINQYNSVLKEIQHLTSFYIKSDLSPKT